MSMKGVIVYLPPSKTQNKMQQNWSVLMPCLLTVDNTVLFSVCDVPGMLIYAVCIFSNHLKLLTLTKDIKTVFLGETQQQVGSPYCFCQCLAVITIMIIV